jgi:hypothetical protein
VVVSLSCFSTCAMKNPYFSPVLLGPVRSSTGTSSGLGGGGGGGGFFLAGGFPALRRTIETERKLSVSPKLETLRK